MIVLLIPFQFRFLVFLLLVWLLWLELWILYWIKWQEWASCLVPDLRNAFHHWVWFQLWACHIWPLLCSGMFHLYSPCWEFFIINGCWILSKIFLPIKMIIWFLFFSLLVWYITLIDLQILNHPCIPRISPTWSWCMILLMYCWIQFTNICGGFLHLCSSVILAYHFLFCVIFVWFLYQGHAELIKWVQKHLFLCSFLEEFEKNRF